MFQAAMYFSMQLVMQVDSPLDKEVPGLGTHFSKQVSWSFYHKTVVSLSVVSKRVIVTWTYLDQSAGIDEVSLLLDLLDNSSLDLCGIHGCDCIGLLESRDVASGCRP
jgi:hypothetical protein